MTIEMKITKLSLSVDDFARCIDSPDEELSFKKFNGWSPRDILAHLIGWNRYIIGEEIQVKRS